MAGERDAARDALISSLITEGISVLAMLAILVMLRRSADLEHLAWRWQRRRQAPAAEYQRMLRQVQADISRMEHSG